MPVSCGADQVKHAVTPSWNYKPWWYILAQDRDLECARNVVVSMIIATVATICLLHHGMFILWWSVLVKLSENILNVPVDEIFIGRMNSHDIQSTAIGTFCPKILNKLYIILEKG